MLRGSQPYKRFKAEFSPRGRKRKGRGKKRWREKEERKLGTKVGRERRKVGMRRKHSLVLQAGTFNALVPYVSESWM